MSFTQGENNTERRNVVVLLLNGKHAVIRRVMVDLCYVSFKYTVE